MSEKTDAYAAITAKMITALEAGTVPWRKPWMGANAPRNGSSGRRYRGINTLLLGMSGHTSPFWFTFKDQAARGGTVKGQKGTQIVFWKILRVPDKANPGKTTTVPMIRFYYVWNLDQITALDPEKGLDLPKSVREYDANAKTPEMLAGAEAVVDAYDGRGPEWHADATDEAYYVPALDVIHVPPRGDFPDADTFYATLFHEFGHSTGHKSRLDRDISNGFGGHAYGREELVAEMTSAFLCAEAGIETTADASASYLASWIRTIREDPRAVVVAAGKAQKAADYVLGREAEEWKDEEKGESTAA